MKRLLCVLLALLMVASVFTVAVSADDVLGSGEVVATADEATVDEATTDEATKDEATIDETEPTEPTEPEEAPVYPTNPKPEGTNRYYFYLPDQWVNEYATTAGIYWWEGSISGEYWPGNAAISAGLDSVYYYDVAVDTPTLIWNNYLDGGTNSSAEIYTAACQSVDISVSGGNYDGMIFVIDLGAENINSYNGKITYGGQWFYYYGSGEYGTAPTKAEADVVYTDKSFGEWSTPDEEPTDAPVVTEPTEAPVVTEPTEAPVVTEPTEAPVVTEPTDAPADTEPTEAPVATEPTEAPEATEDEATTDEATKDEATTDEATKDEATTDEPTEPSDPDEPSEPDVPTEPGEEYELGDVNLDGVLNIKDATAIQKYLAKLLEFDDGQVALADINEDGEVNIKDVTHIQKKLAKLI